MIKRRHRTTSLSPLPETGDHGVRQRTLMKPMSFAYWRKHWRHILRPYFRIRPCRFEQTRLQKETALSLVTESELSALRGATTRPAGLHGPIGGLQMAAATSPSPPTRRPWAPLHYISSSVAPQSNPSKQPHSVSHQEREPWPNFLGWLQ